MKGNDMTFSHTCRGIAGTAVVAMALALGSGVARAQPAGGPHGPGGGGEMIGHVIAHARAQLNLNTMQQELFDRAIASSKAAREKGLALRQTVKATAQAELAKAEPDLAAVAAAADAAADEGRALRRSIRDEWLALYSQFSPEQKAVVRDMLQQRLARAESFRQRMRERVRQFLDGTTG
jgi:Spy/CpxP family protein refolding chaperone